MLEAKRLVEWGDCDDAGVVFYPNYCRWMDGVYHEVCGRIGYDQRTLRSRFGFSGTPLLGVELDFISPATYGDRLTIEVDFCRWGKSSFDIRYCFIKDGSIIVNAKEKRVFVTRSEDEGFRSAPIPPQFRELLDGR